MPAIFDIRHGERVRAIEPTHNIPAGRAGTVKAMIQKGNKTEYLIKWDRVSWPVVAWRNQIERI